MKRAALAMTLVLAAGACAPIPPARESPFHPSDAALAVTRVVHGSFVLELDGTRMAVDPWFHSGVLTRQREPLGLTPGTLPQLAAVLVTADVPDHFDARALRDLALHVPRAIAPPALRERLLDLGFQEVTGLAWWQPTTLDGLTITAVPTAGGPAANGYVVTSRDAQLYLAGPTTRFAGLVDIAVAFPELDVAILPIGGRRVLGVPHEMNPEQAADAAVTLGARRVIPSDYGARSRSPFTWYAGSPLDRFRTAMAACSLADRVIVLEPGESWHYAKP
jgi:L-ascorbate metabolism protein UlaG (beta-lactamase superfamily)